MPAPSFSSSGPMTAADCEHLAAQLLDPLVSPRRKLDIASDLRDSAENNRDFIFYDKYLSIFVPAVLTILGDERTVSFVKDSPDQRYRHTLFTFLQRLPHNEPFRQYEAPIMEAMIKLLRVENEENALPCLKVMIDGFRNHKVCSATTVIPLVLMESVTGANRAIRGGVSRVGEADVRQH